jgi:hypothetical protein
MADTDEEAPDVPTRWCVVKATRTYDGGVGYDGPSMEKAGLTGPAGPYDSYEEAVEVKMALQEVNAVGWRIVSHLGGDG